MPRYDFKCNECGKVVEYSVPLGWETVRCLCGGTLEKQPAAPNFTITGYSAKNGYSNGR